MSDPVTRLNAALEGRYAIVREIGEGGMATVYLAEDVKHDRRVALKVLKPELAAVVGAERFLAEIKTTANLQHPHILALFDSGEVDGFLFFVMPYVEGETLRGRLDREHQLPVDEAMKITTDLAEALDYAHRNEVIHRDIKPANILMQEGRPLIADFGIALAVGAAGGGRMTETGLSLGSPFYMSPEQATGDQFVGSATDIYALGAVLFEMLTGDPPFMGSTAQAVLGQILAGEPPSAAKRRASVPANVDAALRCALEKLPADRFRSGQDFVRALRDPHYRYGEMAVFGLAGDFVPGLWKRLTMAFAAVATLFAVTLGWLLLRPESPGLVTRVSVQIPEEQFFHPVGGALDLSPDGSLMVYQGIGNDEQPQLWVRRWHALDATPIRGTDGARGPAISPDGQEVAFNARGSIRVVPLQGGVSRPLVQGRGFCCARWSPDGAWVYYSVPFAGLRRVPVAGGSAEIVTEVDTDAGDQVNVLPDVLPGGRGVVFTTNGRDGPRIQAVDVGTGVVKDLTPGTFPRYAPTGHLLFIDANQTLLAAPFDVKRLELMGAAAPVAEGLAVRANGRAFFAVSPTGTLVYRTGGLFGGTLTPAWVERDGAAHDIDPEWRMARPAGDQSSLRLSPDGTRLAISVSDSDSGVTDLWVKQLNTDNGPLSRVTFEGGSNIRPTWSEDGDSLRFLSNRAGQFDLWTKRADGTGAAQRLLDRESGILEALYAPDGSWLVFREGVDDILAIRPGLDSVATPLMATEFAERYPALSPNGRWLAYVSDETGRAEIYVSPFPDAGSGRVPVSGNGGTEPVWAHSGRELFYRNGDNELVVVQFTEEPRFTPGRQDILFSMDRYQVADGSPLYDVSADDQRFVMLRIEDSDTELILVRNFFEELTERVGH